MKMVIVAVAYNRPASLQRLLQSLEKAEYPSAVTLVISVDKSDTDVVERMAEEYTWPFGEKRVALHEKNLGLRAHILSLGQYFDEFDAIVVLEDDVTVAPSFFRYAQSCVERYHAEPSIAGISLYAFSMNYQNGLPFHPARSGFDVYLMQCAQSWGQVWMKESWLRFVDWYQGHSEEFCLPHLPEALNKWPRSSWLKYHTRYCIEEGLFFVYPYVSQSTNNADAGTNYKASDTDFQAFLPVGSPSAFHLPALAECVVRYDGFFEPLFLAESLGIPEADLCVRLFSNKPQGTCRYLLSTQRLPFSVLRSFAMELRPMELNVLLQRPGSDIFLYDTTRPASRPSASDPFRLYNYFFPTAFYKARTMIGYPRMCSLTIRLIWKKICNMLNLH